MRLLLLGSGGREHAIAWKISQSKLCTKLFILPGNAGTNEFGENVDINLKDFVSIKDFVLNTNIDMIIVGPEEPLVKGFVDYIYNHIGGNRISIIGPGQNGANLEGSKAFAKKFMEQNNIPTAKYKTINYDSMDEGLEFLKTLNPPYVLKADGLAAGKGVLIIDDLNEARDELQRIFNGKFGDAGKKVVLEEFLEGVELSVFVITDGVNYKILPEAKDYKRIGEGDTGLNTGGMGAVSPVPFASIDFINKVENRIIKPTIEGLKNKGIVYKGFIFFGLINVKGEPYVIEYNVRLGDPEAEAILPRIKNDIVDIFKAVSTNNLKSIEIQIEERTVATVILVSGGYPLDYKKGYDILNLGKVKESIVFHSGTLIHQNKMVTNGGRVIAISSYGNTMKEALNKSYQSAKIIDFKDKFYRADIGFDLN